MCEVSRRGDGQVVHVDADAASGAGGRYAFKFSRGLWVKLLGVLAAHLIVSSTALLASGFLFWHNVEKRHAVQVKTDQAQDKEIGENTTALAAMKGYATGDDVEEVSRKLDALSADFYEFRGEIRGLLLGQRTNED